MNSNTRKYLQEFITQMENLAHAVSSVAGTDTLKRIYEASENLKSQLDKDETIL